jgi:hypothetical protein
MPRQEYIEYLRSQGASDDDIKALTEGSFAGPAIKAFDALQAKAAADAAAADRAARADVNSTWEEWRGRVETEYAGMANDAVAAKAEAARAKAVVLELQKQGAAGLSDIAKRMGYEPDAPPPAAPPAGTPPAFDPKKFVSMDQLPALMEQEGDAMVLLQDIAAEHATLFPGQRLNWRELRKEALAAKQPLEQFWMNKYKVSDARNAAAAAEQKRHDDSIRDETRKALEAEYAARGGSNPDLRLPGPSRHPFAPRAEGGRDKMPWEQNESALANSRVKRGTESFVKDLTGTQTTRPN